MKSCTALTCSGRFDAGREALREVAAEADAEVESELVVDVAAAIPEGLPIGAGELVADGLERLAALLRARVREVRGEVALAEAVPSGR